MDHIMRAFERGTGAVLNAHEVQWLGQCIITMAKTNEKMMDYIRGREADESDE